MGDGLLFGDYGNDGKRRDRSNETCMAGLLTTMFATVLNTTFCMAIQVTTRLMVKAAMTTLQATLATTLSSAAVAMTKLLEGGNDTLRDFDGDDEIVVADNTNDKDVFNGYTGTDLLNMSGITLDFS